MKSMQEKLLAGTKIALRMALERLERPNTTARDHQLVTELAKLVAEAAEVETYVRIKKAA